MIRPDLWSHFALESEVMAYLAFRGFVMDDATYHSKMRRIMPIVQSRFTAQSLYLRGRADRWAVHRTHPVEFEFDIKTHASRSRRDCTIEALPLLHHIAQAPLGVRCLYCFRHDHTGVECGFWTDVDGHQKARKSGPGSEWRQGKLSVLSEEK